VLAEFKFHLIKDFQRLEDEEIQSKSLHWSLTRSLLKINYPIHNNAIAENIIPKTISKLQAGLIYTSETDILNIALLGITANQWRKQKNAKQGNKRDHTSVEDLIVRSNLESINAELIPQSISHSEHLIALDNTAIYQIRSLLGNSVVLKIK
jgi:hypothetical protein